jgi:hypothetical protein
MKLLYESTVITWGNTGTTFLRATHPTQRLGAGGALYLDLLKIADRGT